jgi:hypothetical protein
VWLISHWDHVLESRNDINYVFIDGEPDSLCYFDDKAANMLYIGHKVTHSNIGYFFLLSFAYFFSWLSIL